MKTAEEDSDYLVDHSIVMYVSGFYFGGVVYLLST
jgi:hypothetical protein